MLLVLQAENERHVLLVSWLGCMSWAETNQPTKKQKTLKRPRQRSLVFIGFARLPLRWLQDLHDALLEKVPLDWGCRKGFLGLLL